MPAAQKEGLVVIELFLGISATTEALLRARVKIKKLYCCEIDPKAQAVTKARASDWLHVFPELLKPSALEGFHSFFPQNVTVDWTFPRPSHGGTRLNCCRFPMPGIFSRVRPSPRLSRPKNTPVSGDHARHPLDSLTSGPLRLAYQKR
jgi:hypothetical protein